MTDARSVDRRIRSLAVPALGALAVEPVYVAVDTAIIGHVGTSELAGVALAATVLSIVVAGSNVLAYGATERIARCRGQGDIIGATRIATQSLWVAVAAAAVLTPLVATVGRLITRVVETDPDTAAHAVRYLWISSLGLPAVLGVMAAQGICRGHGDYRTPLIILAVSNGVNVVVELLLVVVAGLSVTGSALSTVIAQWLAALWFIRRVRAYVGPSRQRFPDLSVMADLSRVSGALALRVGSMLVVLSGSTVLAGRSGTGVLAAHQIVMGAFILLALILDALALPAQTLVAEAGGSGGQQLAALIAGRVYTLSLITGVILCAGPALGAGPIATIFSADPLVVDLAGDGLRILAIGLIPGAVAFAGDGILIGSGDFLFLAVASVVHSAVMVAAVAVTGLGAPQLWVIWLLFGGWLVLRAGTVAVRSYVLLVRPHASSAAMTM